MTIRNLIDELRAASDALSPEHEVSVDGGDIVAAQTGLTKFGIEGRNKCEAELKEARDEVRELCEELQRKHDRVIAAKNACRAALSYIADGSGSKKDVMEALSGALG